MKIKDKKTDAREKLTVDNDKWRYEQRGMKTCVATATSGHALSASWPSDYS